MRPAQAGPWTRGRPMLNGRATQAAMRGPDGKEELKWSSLRWEASTARLQRGERRKRKRKQRMRAWIDLLLRESGSNYQSRSRTWTMTARGSWKGSAGRTREVREEDALERWSTRRGENRRTSTGLLARALLDPDERHAWTP